MKLSKIFAAGLLAASVSFAQEGEQANNNASKSFNDNQFGVGARAAFNYNKMYGLADDWNVYADNEDAPAGIGFEAGLAARLQIFPFMQFTPEVLFCYGKLTQDDGDMEREFKQMSIEFPLLFRINPIDKFYLTVGPNLELNISDEIHINSGEMTLAGTDETFYHEFPEDYDRNGFLMGVTFGAGYYVYKGLSIDFRMNMGLTDVYDGESLLIDLSGGKQMTFKFGLGYWFM